MQKKIFASTDSVQWYSYMRFGRFGELRPPTSRGCKSQGSSFIKENLTNQTKLAERKVLNRVYTLDCWNFTYLILNSMCV